MSKRVTAVRRKSSKLVSNRSASNKKVVRRRLPNKSAPIKANKSPVKKTLPKRVKPAAHSKATTGKTKPTLAPARKKAPAAKKAVSRPGQLTQMIALDQRSRANLKVVTKAVKAEQMDAMVHKAPIMRPAGPIGVSDAEPLTPRSVAPPALDEGVQQAKGRLRIPAKFAVRAAYVSPAQRVLEAQQAAQLRARRVQQSKDDAPSRSELTPASEVIGSGENAAVSSEPRTSTAFVRRGRLGPRDPNSGPGSEPLANPAIGAGSFDKEWQLIAATAQNASIKLERELVQGWLEPWLNGKDTLALIQSAIDSSDAYFVATQALCARPCWSSARKVLRRKLLPTLLDWG